MIIWLASYPRAGNTLLRTVLHQTMGHRTYSDEVDANVRRNVALTEAVERRYGRTDLPREWDGFYPEASGSSETYFVKTHRPPRDGQPAIYVVRDGRSTLASYGKFHRQFQAERGKSLLQLVLGDDYYGGWSDHYRGWTGRGAARTLVVRYEELVNASAELLGRIAEFAGHAARIESWKNPFEEMNQDNPSFFSAGRARWEGDASWTSWIDEVFFEVHGDLMEELGYASRPEVASSRGRIGAHERELIRLARSLAEERLGLDRICRERQAVIDGLHRACEERLALIERLSAR